MLVSGDSSLISIICVSNDKTILDQCLTRSLAQQRGEFELIIVDNSTGKWASAASALNWGARDAKGEILMFVHQDFVLESSDWLHGLEQFGKEQMGFGAAGVAGMLEVRDEAKAVVSNITHHWPVRNRVSPIEVTMPMEVQTLDECLIAVTREVFARFPFDESTCDNWHLYGVDLSLTVIESGLKVYVLPLGGYHRSNVESMGSGDYNRSLRRVIKKHRKSFTVVYTTCGIWSTRRPLIIQIISKRLQVMLRKIERGPWKSKRPSFLQKALDFMQSMLVVIQYG